MFHRNTFDLYMSLNKTLNWNLALCDTTEGIVDTSLKLVTTPPARLRSLLKASLFASNVKRDATVQEIITCSRKAANTWLSVNLFYEIFGNVIESSMMLDCSLYDRLRSGLLAL